TSWYQRRNIDLRLAEAIKFYAVAGTGFVHRFWNPDAEDVDMISEDPRNVLPIRPTDYTTLESCLGVIVKRKVPVSYLRDRYKINVTSDSDGSALTWLEKVRDYAADVVSPIWKWASSSRSSATAPNLPRIPTAWLYTCYLKDHRRNTREDMGDLYTGDSVYMGRWEEDEDGEYKPLTNWSYEVKKGEALYPHRRMIMWAGMQKIHDGPMYQWAGLIGFPVQKLTLNPYPWSWFGKAPVWDLLPLGRSKNQLLRVIDDHLAQVAEPGSIHDKNNVSESTFKSFSTRKAGYKIRQNPMAGKGIQGVNPPPLEPAAFEYLKWMENEEATLAGTQDLSPMMKLGQLPSDESIEMILRSMTPGLRARSRILEAFHRDLALQLTYDFTQFYSMPMRVTILGPGGIVQDDFDFDPGSMVPDFVHDGDYTTNEGVTSISADAIL